MKFQDHNSPPCPCGECVQAGVSRKPQIRDPQSGKWLHGYALKRYYDTADEVLEKIRALIQSKGMTSDVRGRRCADPGMSHQGMAREAGISLSRPENNDEERNPYTRVVTTDGEQRRRTAATD